MADLGVGRRYQSVDLRASEIEPCRISVEQRIASIILEVGVLRDYCSSAKYQTRYRGAIDAEEHYHAPARAR